MFHGEGHRKIALRLAIAVERAANERLAHESFPDELGPGQDPVSVEISRQHDSVVGVRRLVGMDEIFTEFAKPERVSDGRGDYNKQQEQ